MDIVVISLYFQCFISIRFKVRVRVREFRTLIGGARLKIYNILYINCHILPAVGVGAFFVLRSINYNRAT